MFVNCFYFILLLQEFQCGFASKLLVIGGFPNEGMNEIIDLKNGNNQCNNIGDEPSAKFKYGTVGGLLSDQPVLCGGAYIDTNQCYTVKNIGPLLAGTLHENRMFSSSAVLNNSLWITGGFDGTSLSKTTEIFHLELGKSSPGPELPYPVYHHCVAKINDYQAIIIGGFFNLDPPYLYDFQTDTWTVLPNLMQPRGMLGCATFLDEGLPKVIVTGGTISGQVFSSTEILDIQSRTWNKGLELPQPIYKHSMVTESNQVYIIGGETGQGFQSTIYQMMQREWRELTQKIQTARCQFTAMLVPDQLVKCEQN